MNADRPVRAIFFDAVGTLIFPRPAVATIYAQVGRQYGSCLDEKEIGQRFRRAFQRQEGVDRPLNFRTSPDREKERWRAIVADVFHDQPNPSAAFEELWTHFARGDAWACYEDVEVCLRRLAEQGFTLGIASNYDERLRSVVAGLTDLGPCRNLVISADHGWRKPAPGFFQAMAAEAGVPPEHVLLVGDDRANDFDAGRAAGIRTLLISREAISTSSSVITSLIELPEKVSKL